MSVITELRVAPDEFELGRLMNLSDHTTVVLERMVPLGQTPVPFFRVRDADRDTFEGTLQRHPSVETLTRLHRQDGETLYALEWIASRDRFFSAMTETGAQLVSATGTPDSWTFELRFPSHEALSRFHEYCEEADIPITVDRIYSPTTPGMGPWFGLTPEQRTTLVSAVRGGYYDIPRRMSTQDLADEFGISDQAITERLRRGIASLVEHTLLPTDTVEE
ncbi:helix-turn-helix domain-containing protein [Salinigranum rubrum]|uniref:Helix-turn-helix domain-containing protein n=1 Tax=Salinigranum rubrum TaxID=755307 RepID=A0A2I8VFN0_9EURY|nr:helix-turn-helix domain-containing protein [Salinigranum rubrum]AUV80740.1 helix-turn-helix domain-containing protein [Salinigranum rubrum]